MTSVVALAAVPHIRRGVKCTYDQIRESHVVLFPEGVLVLNETAASVDEEVRSIVDRVFERAQGILKARRVILDRAAKKLLEKETLEQSDLDALIRETPKEALRAV